MYKAIILPLAKEDISEAVAWFESKQEGLGKQFTQEVRNKVLLIRKNPEISAIRYDKVRATVLDVFPFMIHYAIDKKKKTVIISAVFHTSLDPDKWRQRKK